MTISEASKFLNCSERTVRRAIKDGLIQTEEFLGKHGREYRINSESLEAYRSFRDRSINPEKQTPQSLKTIEETGKVGTTGQIMSMENIETFLSSLNSFINNVKTLDRPANKGRQISDLPDICDTREASIYLGVSPRQVREFIKNGELKGIRLGRGLKITKFGLETFMKKKFCEKKRD